MLLLMTGNSKKDNYGLTSDSYAGIQPNIYMHLLASYARKCGIEVETIDSEAENISNKELNTIIASKKPSLVGIICMGSNPSSSTMSMVGVKKFFKEYTCDIPTFLWGGHPSVLPELSLRETGASYVIVGEGYREIVRLYNSGSDTRIVRTESLMDVNELPPVDWDRIDPYKYRAHNWHCLDDLDNRSPYGVVWTSLGCPYGCDFCCINNMFGKRTYRMREMKDVVAEIDILVGKGVRNIKILDELFVIDHPRIDEFCDLLEQRNYDLNMWCFARVDTVSERILKRLKAVGLNWIAYGFESVSQKIIDGSSKNVTVDTYENTIHITRLAGINIIADVIAGFKEDTYGTLNDMYEFLVKHNFEAINIYPAFAFPGTPLYKDRSEPLSWNEYSLYGDTCVPTGTDYLTPREVVRWRDWKFTEYIKRPEYLNRIEMKFGVNARLHMEEMGRNPLRRVPWV